MSDEITQTEEEFADVSFEKAAGDQVAQELVSQTVRV